MTTNLSNNPSYTLTETLTRHKTNSLETFTRALKDYLAATPLYDGLTYQLTLRDNNNPDKTILRRIAFKYDDLVENPLPDFYACHTFQFDCRMMRNYRITSDTRQNAEHLIEQELLDRLDSGALTVNAHEQELTRLADDSDSELVRDFLDHAPFICQLICCYDHSGRTYSTKPFSDYWDSGTVAVAYVNICDFYNRDEHGNVTNPDTAEKDARQYLDAAIESWLHWLNNEYYCVHYQYPLTRTSHITYTDENGDVRYDINSTSEEWETDFCATGYTDDIIFDAVYQTFQLNDIIDISLVEEKEN